MATNVMDSAPKSTYSQGHSKEVIASHSARTVSNSAAFLLPHLRPHFSLLDIGCGPGTITSGFCDYLSQGHVTGVDPGESVVEHAISSHPSEKFPNLTFSTGDVLDGLKYEDESFDVVFFHQTILHLPDPVQGMKEARRVLKPGGLLAMRESDNLNWYPNFPGLGKYNECLDKMLRSAGAPGLFAARGLHAWARQAGFEREKMAIGAGTTVYSSPEERKWWGTVHVGRLSGEAVGGKMKTLGLLGEDELKAMVGDFERWIEDEDGWYTALQCELVAKK
ncbi:MAG: hypothetical protein L6R37_008073 [Teloschistes peruensis]|nr:MAG: hypothetical protein L6R37_008073 [Teloschistes peruensis]